MGLAFMFRVVREGPTMLILVLSSALEDILRSTVECELTWSLVKWPYNMFHLIFELESLEKL